MRIFHTNPKRYPAFLCTENRVYLARVDPAGKSFVTYIEKPLAAKCIVNDEIVNPDAFVQVIRSMVAEGKLVEKDVIIGVSEVKATTRSLVFPTLKPDEIAQAVEQQSSSFLPFPYHDEYLDWMIIDKEAHGKEKILISAIPKTVIDGYCAVFQKAGLRPVAFESTSLSLFRILPEEAKKSSIAIEAGEVNTLLILGFEGSIEASSVIQETAGIEDKIEKLINYYSGKRTGGTVPETVYICGKNATPEIGQLLNQRLHLKPVFLPAAIVNIPPQKKLELAVLSSLAKKIVDMPEDPQTINVLPEPLAKAYEAQKKHAAMKLFLFVQILLLVLMASVAGYTLWSARADRMVIERENMQNMQNGQMEPLNVDAAYTKAIVSADGSAHAVGSTIDVLLKTSVEGVTVKGISYTQEAGSVTVSGTAHSRDHLLAFQDAIEKTGNFSQVTIPLSSLEEETDVTFRMVLQTK